MVEEAPEPQKGSMLWKLMLGGLVGGLLMAVAVILLGPSRGGTTGATLPTAVPDNVIEGEPAPEIVGKSADGDDIKLSTNRGSVVAVNFWATWCAPCKVEMPTLQKAYEAHRLVVLGVNAGDSPEAVKSYMADLNLDFPVVLDQDGSIVDLYGVHVFPTTVFVDADGKVLAEHYGPLTQDLIDQYLSAASQPATSP